MVNVKQWFGIKDYIRNKYIFNSLYILPTSTHMNPTTQFTKEEIEEGIRLQQFEVYYQPIIDKKKQVILSGEALVRWNHPKLGFLHPGSFITLAESTGAIIALGDFVLREACEQSKKWKEEGHPFYNVTVNLSFLQLAEADFVQHVKAIIVESGINPHHLQLEITESMAMINPTATENALIALQGIGVRIILDDFGAGYSSLAHLHRLPFDGLKIDGQFIQNSLQTEKGSKLVRSIISLAKSIKVHIVAEGVETKEQQDTLENMDCYNMQGFYFTRPLPCQEYKEWCLYYLNTPELRMI